MGESVHTSADLAQMQSLPLEAKVVMSKQRIKAWYEAWKGQCYVAFSGGKDSTVLLHLVRKIYPDIEAVFVDTGLEYPEIKEFAKSQSNVVVVRPTKTFRQVIQDFGYPLPTKTIAHTIKRYRAGGEYARQCVSGTATKKDGRPSRYNLPSKWKPLTNAPFEVSDYCCVIMKERPSHKYGKQNNKYPMLGTMASESFIRRQSWMQYGCNAFGKKQPQSTPLAFWTENDILTYIKQNNLQIASVYGEIVPTGRKIKTAVGEVDELTTTGVKRTGCMFCLFGAHRGNDTRFSQMRSTHPKQYEYCMKPLEEGGLGLKAVIDWCNENCKVNIKY